MQPISSSRSRKNAASFAPDVAAIISDSQLLCAISDEAAARRTHKHLKQVM